MPATSVPVLVGNARTIAAVGQTAVCGILWEVSIRSAAIAHLHFCTICSVEALGSGRDNGSSVDFIPAQCVESIRNIPNYRRARGDGVELCVGTLVY